MAMAGLIPAVLGVGIVSSTQASSGVLACNRSSSKVSAIGVSVASCSSRLWLGAQSTSCAGGLSGNSGAGPRNVGVGKKFAHICAQLDDSRIEFHDNGADLEVRVELPVGLVGKDGANISARHVQVVAKDKALFVTLQTSDGVRLILSAARLYGHIKASETIWYVDEKEVVLSLKKMDADIRWPDLVEAWASLASGVAELLKGTTIYTVGSSSDINWAVARELAEALEFVPLCTQQLIQELTNTSPTAMAAAEGDQAVTEAEAAILDSLSSNVRCAVATLGGNHGVAAQHSGWKGLHAGFTIWLSQSDAEDETAAEQEAAKAKQEGRQSYAKADVVVALAGWDETSARPAAEGALRALKYLLESDKELQGKKSLYVRLGCRGDWPNIMPPGWDPLTGKQKTASAFAL